MTPLQLYQEKIAEGVIVDDSEQRATMQLLDGIYHDLILENKARQGLRRFFHRRKMVQGLYLWGGVGVGKTFMMDCFYQSLPFQNKMRMHFHQFMQEVHHALKKHQGEEDPLLIIAKEISQKTLILCFDEFYVSDIADAMLLGRLLNALFDNGVCFVATSNVKPDDLYKSGLQRSQFLPAINLLKSKTKVIHISTSHDYRMRHLKEAGVFYTPLDDRARQNMAKSFDILTQGQPVDYEPLLINDRLIPVVKRTSDIVWFDFQDICHVPRSQQDYLVIAQSFKTIFVSNITSISAHEKDTICLFISMVDVFYDSKIRLVFSAASPVEELYNTGYMILEYTRTHSRLLEMQSVDYFSGEFDHS